MAKPENYINLGRPQNMAGILAECERINREGVTRRESVGDYNGGILFHGMASEFALCEEFARTGVECKRAPAQTKGYDLTIGESRIEVKAIKRYQEPIPLETDDVFLDYEKPIDWNFIIFTSASFGMMYNYEQGGKQILSCRQYWAELFKSLSLDQFWKRQAAEVQQITALGYLSRKRFAALCKEPKKSGVRLLKKGDRGMRSGGKIRTAQKHSYHIPIRALTPFGL